MKKVLFLLLAAGITFSACKKDKDTTPDKNTPSNPSSPTAPTADFQYSGAGLAPATVSFTNNSTNAKSFYWDFGDNGNSTQKNPTHVYTQGGVYTVKLTALNDGAKDEITKTINIRNPTSAKITNIIVTQMPLTDQNGGGWDNNSGPDVFYKILDGNDNVIVTSTNYFEDVTGGALPLNFSLSPAFQVTNFSKTYKIILYDYDEDDFPPNENDWIGGYSFTLNNATINGYPTTFTLFAPGGNIKMELKLQWQ